ncbi:MAG: family 2A encapsulin nanocompartment cargo protein cysteine desulfurase [Eubacteriales bacterium]|nr:family 2A encapsulin nanocompartment cargo protein cysteine desulfurase [Eubacteriales bacterium]
MITNKWTFQQVPLIKERNSEHKTREVKTSFPHSVEKDYYKSFPVHTIRKDFPILSEKINGKQLIWFDNAATTQKPKSMIERLNYYYLHENSNVHRGAHTLAAKAADAYESAREIVSCFLHASSPKEIIFVRGATEGINLIAQTYGKQSIRKGEEILISHLEHHANIVPWQMLCKETGAILRVIPVDDTGQIILDEYEKLLNEKTKLVSITHVSNAVGTVTPVRNMIRLAHSYGAKVLIDGAQAVSHLAVDVTELECDFYVFSGHKIYGPTGIGILYARSEILHEMPPYQGGGNMIDDVTFEKTRYQDPPVRFEAGTGSIGDAIGLGAALKYVMSIGQEKIFLYEHTLLEYAQEKMLSIPGLTLVGTAEEKTSILSFILKGYEDAEIGKALNEEGIAVRTGHHCAQPILRRFGLESTIRPSIAFYNTREEVDEMVRVLTLLQKGSSKIYLHN